MRRFEFVEGTSSKFWMPEVQGTTFIVTYGRIGTAGSARRRPSPTRRPPSASTTRRSRRRCARATTRCPPRAPQAAPAARRRRRRRSEARAAAPRAAAASPAPSRWPRPCGAHLLHAPWARSWQVTRLAREARRALRALGGVDPAGTRPGHGVRRADGAGGGAQAASPGCRCGWRWSCCPSWTCRPSPGRWSSGSARPAGAPARRRPRGAVPSGRGARRARAGAARGHAAEERPAGPGRRGLGAALERARQPALEGHLVSAGSSLPSTWLRSLDAGEDSRLAERAVPSGRVSSV